MDMEDDEVVVVGGGGNDEDEDEVIISFKAVERVEYAEDGPDEGF